MTPWDEAAVERVARCLWERCYTDGPCWRYELGSEVYWLEDAQAALNAALSPELRELMEAAQQKVEWTRLQVDDDPINGGFRVHDMPDQPNQHGIWWADLLVEGWEEQEAKWFTNVVNAALAFARSVRAGREG